MSLLNFRLGLAIPAAIVTSTTSATGTFALNVASADYPCILQISGGNLRTELVAAGYTIPSNWTAGSTALFTSAFNPNPASDPFDQLLESIAAAITSDEARSSPGFPVGVQLHTVPAQPGTYACDSHQGNTWRKVNVWFHWNGTTCSAGARQSSGTGPAGASCSITVTKELPNYEASVTVTDGLFRRE